MAFCTLERLRFLGYESKNEKKRCFISEQCAQLSTELFTIYGRMKWFFRFIRSGLYSSNDALIIRIIAVAAIMLSLVNYFGSGAEISLMLWEKFEQAWVLSPLVAKSSWALLCFFAYALIPCFIATWVWKIPLSQQGLSFHLPKEHRTVYRWAIGLMLPLVFAVSFLPSFQKTYPFVPFETSPFQWKSFLIWEGFYLLQFVGVEYFFRGFLLLPLREKLGSAAVYLPILPYVMIHFGKPLPETLAAAFAGWFLGQLAYRSGTILPGIALHFGVAISMDLLSLWQKS